ncbi:hypothetical protein PPTG_14964 [Phytophthora nicotianae INRA-310]|uniref:Uncharacterized protein n=1 Tax=Phytophthora nicotianae (strain INRA-310) TaxID=761204 RepID=W2PTJ1_PHYN3|nr:hypothetical protein PPTG_14964 [Phytophthora nicotianae INRA-310]ETN04263.1 hypothetical protein PPTG_14964 [Phytophthora nicotianae INRA-310]
MALRRPRLQQQTRLLPNPPRSTQPPDLLLDRSAPVESAAGSTATPVALAAMEVPGMTVKDSIQLSESFGGLQGVGFSDKNFVNSGQTVGQISIYAGERLDGISLEISAPKSLTFTTVELVDIARS